MKCNEARALLTLYASGDLEFSEATQVREHLKTCAGCAASLERERVILEALADAGRRRKAPPKLLDEITEGVMARLSEPAAAPRAIYSAPPSPSRAVAALALAAAALFAALLVLYVMREQPTAAPADSRISPAAPAFADTMGRPNADTTADLRAPRPGERRLQPVGDADSAAGNSRYWRKYRDWREEVETPDNAAIRTVSF